MVEEPADFDGATNEHQPAAGADTSDRNRLGDFTCSWRDRNEVVAGCGRSLDGGIWLRGAEWLLR